jgi:Fe-S-cluster containining protein
MRSASLTPAEVARRCRYDCDSRCCRYITVVLPAPRRKADFDELSWFLAHKDISVYVEERRWHLEVRTPCKYLNDANLCTVYEGRPDICREYDIEDCEFPARPSHSLHFDTKEEFDAWMTDRKGEKRRRAPGRSAQPTRASP